VTLKPATATVLPAEGFVLPLGVYCRGRGGHVVFRPNTIALLAGMVPLVYAVGVSARGLLRSARH
jgi:hypothetical protein